MLAAAPVAVELTTAVAKTVALPIVLACIVSPDVKAKDVLFVPVLLYLMYKVSGSVPSVATAFIQIPITPDVTPVNCLPTYSATVAKVLDVSFTA